MNEINPEILNSIPKGTLSYYKKVGLSVAEMQQKRIQSIKKKKRREEIDQFCKEHNFAITAVDRRLKLGLTFDEIKKLYLPPYRGRNEGIQYKKKWHEKTKALRNAQRNKQFIPLDEEILWNQPFWNKEMPILESLQSVARCSKEELIERVKIVSLRKLEKKQRERKVHETN